MFEILIKAVDFIFSPITVFPPAFAILIFAVFLTLLIFFLNRLTTNKNLMKELKEKMEKIKADLEKAQKEGDKEKFNKILSEMMNLNKAYMKQTFKSLVISIIVIAIFLPWAKYKYQDVIIAMPFNLPFINSFPSWLLWYVLVAFTASWILQKLVGY